MIGEALTTRLKLTLHFRLEFLGIHLDCIDPGTPEGQDEAPPIHPGDLGPASLRDLAAAVPVDRRRQAQLAGEVIRRRRGSHDVIWEIDRDGRHSLILPRSITITTGFHRLVSLPDPVTEACFSRFWTHRGRSKFAARNP
jgi:hypothetical protein